MYFHYQVWLYTVSCTAYLSKYFYIVNASDLSHMISTTNKKSATAYMELKVIHFVIKHETLTKALFMKGEWHLLIDQQLNMYQTSKWLFEFSVTCVSNL